MADPTATRLDFALLILRLSLAAGLLVLVVFKIAGYSGNVAFYTTLNFPLPAVIAPVNMGLELVSGILLVLGWRTRLAAVLVVVDTLLIVTPVNIALGESGGWWWVGLLRLGIAAALYLTGPGTYRLGTARAE